MAQLSGILARLSNPNEVFGGEKPQHKDQNAIVTLCASLDELICPPGSVPSRTTGGVCRGQLTELVGPSGVGKSTLCLQLCLNVQIHPSLGGCGGEALYIDTEQSFCADQLMLMATELQNHISRVTTKDGKPKDKYAKYIEGINSSVDPASMLERVHVLELSTDKDLASTVFNLHEYLCQHPAIKLVVIDSIALHWRHRDPTLAQSTSDVEQAAIRSRLMCKIGQTLHYLAHTHNVAVVITNHVTVSAYLERAQGVAGHPTAVPGVNDKEYIPALSDTWAHFPSVRLMMRWEGSKRLALLMKHVASPPGLAQFTVSHMGIRQHKPPLVAPQAKSVASGAEAEGSVTKDGQST